MVAVLCTALSTVASFKCSFRVHPLKLPCGALFGPSKWAGIRLSKPPSGKVQFHSHFFSLVPAEAGGRYSSPLARVRKKLDYRLPGFFKTGVSCRVASPLPESIVCRIFQGAATSRLCSKLKVERFSFSRFLGGFDAVPESRLPWAIFPFETFAFPSRRCRRRALGRYRPFREASLWRLSHVS